MPLSSVLSRRIFPWFGCTAVCVLALGITQVQAQPAEAALPDASTSETVQRPQGQLPLQELRNFTEIFERIRTAYVEEVDDKTLLEYAINGMLTSLDPHSAYLQPEAFSDLQENTSGKFGGLGIEVGLEDGLILWSPRLMTLQRKKPVSAPVI